MTKDEANSLRPGDRVYWTDPDDDECSKSLTIRTVSVLAGSDDPDDGYDGDPMISIEAEDCELECFASELELLD